MRDDVAALDNLGAGNEVKPSKNAEIEVSGKTGDAQAAPAADDGAATELDTLPGANEAVTETPGNAQPAFQKEEVPGGPLMLAAYIALWVVLFFFVFWTRKSQEQLREEVARLEDALDGPAGSTSTE